MSKSKKDVIALDFLKTSVYPELHQALIQLIDHVVKTEEVIKHQEQLKKIKIFDKLEQRRVEKERLRQELGSEYESSDDSVDWEEMGIDKAEIEQFLTKKASKKKIKDDEDHSAEHIESEDVDKQSDHNKISRQSSKEQDTDQKDKDKQKLNELGQIQENEEQADEEEVAHEKSQLDQMKLFLQKQREADQYNPLIHLSELLRTVIQNRK